MWELSENQLIEWIDADGNQTTERILHEVTPTPEQDEAEREWILIAVVLSKKRAGRGGKTKKVHKTVLPFIRTFGEFETAFRTRSVRLLARDPFMDSQPVEDMIPEKHRLRRDKNFALIEQLVSDPKFLLSAGRGAAATELSEASKRQKHEIYRLLSQFWQGGQTPNALLPLYFHADGSLCEIDEAGNKRGPKGTGIPTGPNERKHMSWGINQFIVKNKESIRDAYVNTMGKFWHNGMEKKDGVDKPVLLPPDERPTKHQFRYLYKKELKADPERFEKARIGEHKFLLHGRKIIGELTQRVKGAGTRFIIDGTPADTELVGEGHRLPIGSPSIFLAFDASTHLITGVNVTLETDSYLSAALALENACTDKVEYAAAFGLTLKPSDWPCHHVPQSVQADRGQLIHKMADDLFKALKTRIDILPKRRPDWKSALERFNRTLNQRLLHRLPGAKTPRERGDKDPKLSAALTMKEFTQLVILEIVNYNKTWMENYRLSKAMIEAEMPPIPIELWNWSKKTGNSSLREISQKIIRANLLPKSDAKVDLSGLTRGDVCYTLPPDFSFSQYVILDKLKNSMSVAYDPRSMNHIFLRRVANSELVSCPLHPRDTRFQDWTWREHQEWKKALAAQRRERQGDEDQRQSDTNTHVKHVADEAIAATKKMRKPGESKASRVNGVDNRRLAEQRIERQERSERDGHLILAETSTSESPLTTEDWTAPDEVSTTSPHTNITQGVNDEQSTPFSITADQLRKIHAARKKANEPTA